MKLVINGREYDAATYPFIGDLRLLKAEFGFGWGEVVRRLSGMKKNADLLELIDDDLVVEALIAWMWMARLRAGERDVTRAEVEATPLDGIEFRDEPGDELPEDGSVPTSARSVSDPGYADAGQVNKQRAPRSTRTSKRLSTAV